MLRRSAALALTFGIATALAGCGGEDVMLPPPIPEVVEVPVDNCPKTPGTICTIAGTGVAGDGKDLLHPLATRLYAPVDLAFGPTGKLVIVDWNNHRIRALESNGTLRIVAGIGELAPDPDDETSTRLNHPTDVTFDAQGRLVIAAWHNSRIKRLDFATGALEDI
ncbi:MAG TPA: hypothetical protein VGG33_21550, partial [Polyangia bacterium]